MIRRRLDTGPFQQQRQAVAPQPDRDFPQAMKPQTTAGLNRIIPPHNQPGQQIGNGQLKSAGTGQHKLNLPQGMGGTQGPRNQGPSGSYLQSANGQAILQGTAPHYGDMGGGQPVANNRYTPTPGMWNHEGYSDHFNPDPYGRYGAADSWAQIDRAVAAGIAPPLAPGATVDQQMQYMQMVSRLTEQAAINNGAPQGYTPGLDYEPYVYGVQDRSQLPGVPGDYYDETRTPYWMNGAGGANAQYGYENPQEFNPQPQAAPQAAPQTLQNPQPAFRMVPPQSQPTQPLGNGQVTPPQNLGNGPAEPVLDVDATGRGYTYSQLLGMYQSIPPGERMRFLEAHPRFANSMRGGTQNNNGPGPINGGVGGTLPGPGQGGGGNGGAPQPNPNPAPSGNSAASTLTLSPQAEAARRALEDELAGTLASIGVARDQIPATLNLIITRLMNDQAEDLRNTDEAANARGIYNSGIRSTDRGRVTQGYDRKRADVASDAARQLSELASAESGALAGFNRSWADVLLDLAAQAAEDPNFGSGESEGDTYDRPRNRNKSGGNKKNKKKKNNKKRRRRGNR